MTRFVPSRRRRRNPVSIKSRSPLPLAARVLMRRFNLMPGLALAIAAAAGFNIEVK